MFNLLTCCALVTGVVIAFSSGSIAQDLESGELAEAAARAQTRADAKRDAQRLIFFNDTFMDVRDEVSLDQKILDRTPLMGSDKQIPQ